MKPFSEVIDGIRKAIMASEVREDIAQMGEYVEQFANTAGENIQKAIDPTLSLSGKAADAAKVGEAVNAESERANGVENQLKEDIKILSNRVMGEIGYENIIDASIQNLIAYSASTKSAFYKLIGGKSYTIIRQSTKMSTFIIALTDSNEIGATLLYPKKEYNVAGEEKDTSTEILLKPSENCYLCISFYSSEYETIYSPSDVLSMYFVVDNENGLISELKNYSDNSYVKQRNDEKYISYYATIENTQNLSYTNSIVEIKCKFKQGEVYDCDCIALELNGVDIPFQIESTLHANSLVEKDYTKYGDNSYNAISLFFIDSYAPLEKKTYKIKLYGHKIIHNYAVKVIDSSEMFPLISTANGAAYYMTKKKPFWDKKGFCGMQSTTQTYIHYNEVYYALNDDSVKVIEEKHGSGVVFRDYVYTGNFFDKFKIVQTVRVCANGNVIVKTKGIALSDIKKDILDEISLGGIEILNLTSAEIFNSNPLNSAFINANGVNIQYVVECVTGNIKRYNLANINTYTPNVQIGIGDGTRLTTRLGWKNENVISAVSNDIVFNTCVHYVYNSDGNDVQRISNKLIGVASNTRCENNIEYILASAKSHLRRLSISLSDLININDSRKVVLMYGMYKILKNISLDDVILQFKSTYTDATSPQDIYDIFINKKNSKYNGQFIGKNAPIALYLYNECKAMGYNEAANYFKDFIVLIGEFYVLQYKNLGNFYLAPNALNNNGICSGLYCVSQAMMFSDDDELKTAYNSVKNILLNEKCFYDTIMPDESNMTTGRYIHYEVYALSLYIRAELLCGNEIKNNFFDRLIDYISSNGQLKDEEYEASTERRGQGLTYAYMIHCLIFSNKYGLCEMAKNCFDSYMENDNLDGSIEWPLDGYPSSQEGSATRIINREEITEMLNILYFFEVKL